MLKTLLVVALCTGTLSAADIYVSNSGNNANPGAIGSPKLTVAGALSAATAGDTIILRNGSYAGDVEIDKANITIRSHTGEWAHVSTSYTSSANSQCIWITAAGSTLSDLEISGGYYYCIKYEGIDNHVVEDCIVHGSGRDCFKITPHSDNITIRRCEIYDSGLRDPSNAEGIDNVNSDDMHVHDCYIHDIATNGIYPKGGARDAIIERNLITDCGSGGVFLGFQTDSVYMNLAGDNNPQYYENIDGTVRNNIIVNTVYAGIGFCSALNSRVYNNTLYNVATGGMSAIHFHPRDGDNSLNPPCTGLQVFNNIVVMNQGTRPLVNVRTGTGGYDTLASGGLTMGNNRYYRIGGSVHFRDDQTGQTNQTLAQWKTAMGTDTTTTEGDPSLNASWHLNGGSPCIGTGTLQSSFSDDYDGNTRGGSWDIGADQSGGTALQTPPGAGTIGTGGGSGPPPSPPSSPNGLAGTATGSLGADLNWTDTSSNETGFRIERRSVGGSYSSVGTVGAGTTTFSESGLSAGQDYNYRVFAYNAGGDSTASNEITLTGTSTPVAPSAPSNCNASSVGGLSIHVTWTDASSNEDGFTLERRDTGTYAVVQTLAVNSTSFTDSGLTDGVQYTYRLRAFNTVGDSANSNESSAVAALVAPVGGSGGGGGGGGGGCTQDAAGMSIAWLGLLAFGVLVARTRREA